nr:hypothetical protein [Flavobacterium nitratireducens]
MSSMNLFVSSLSRLLSFSNKSSDKPIIPLNGPFKSCAMMEKN